jgi:TolA-binding protein
MQDPRHPIGLRWTSTVLLAAALLPGSVFAEEKPPAASAGYAEIGLSLERARDIGNQVTADWNVTAQQLELLQQSDAEAPHRSVPRWLAAELQYVEGDYDDAAESFHDASKDARGSSFEDDAAFAAIEALEASGDDPEAVKAWVKWEKRYPHSALVGEAHLHRLWNALRRQAFDEATNLKVDIEKQYSWLVEDARFERAVATLAYYDGRFQEALEILALDTTPSGGYLRALCHDAMGSTLKAAAEYQEVAAQAADVDLRDHAAFAKAETFFRSHSYRSAAEEFVQVAEQAQRPDLRAEAALRAGAARMLDGDETAAQQQLTSTRDTYPETSAAGRAQFLLGEMDYAAGRYEEAIASFNRVLEKHFEQSLAATAQYRVARSLDALGRGAEATASYQAVVSGYSLEREAPAAAYLAGVGLLEQGVPRAAAPYFQIVLDRYAGEQDGAATYVFESDAHQELVEAAVCLLMVSYHRAGDLGQLSGVPHLALQRMPASSSTWRAYALLIDADALASQGRYAEAQKTLESIVTDFGNQHVAVRAQALLAWTHAQQGEFDLAIEAQEKLLRRATTQGDATQTSDAFLNRGHVLFNRKDYEKAAVAYEEFLGRFPAHAERPEALYQVGLVYMRLDRNGDAVDRWETLVAETPDAPMAEKAWLRAADLYFRAGRFDDAKRCFTGLLEHFDGSDQRAMCMLRLAQCEYNAGRDAEALQAYSEVVTTFPGTAQAIEAESGVQQSLYRLGAAADGVDVLTELVERFPTSPFAADAQFRVARMLYDDEKYVEAADAFRRVVSQFPTFSAANDAHFLMADAYEQAGDLDAAQRGYEQFTTFFPDDELRPTASFRLAALHFANQEYARASVGFLSVVDAESGDDMKKAALFNLALCRKQLGDAVQAEQFLADYLQKYPKDERTAEVSFHLGELQENAGRTDQAVAQYQKALASRPEKSLKPQLYFRLGVCHEALGDDKAALASFKSAQSHPDKSDPYRLSAVVRLAAIYENKAQYKSALGAYKDLIRHAGDAELVAVATERVTQLEQALQ